MQVLERVIRYPIGSLEAGKMGTAKQDGTGNVLVVIPEDRRSSLLRHLEPCGMGVLPVDSCREACQILQTNSQVEVILTDPTLPDGSWCDLLVAAARHGRRARTVICMRTADPMLWIDVLEGGAFDVLVEPYQPEEVRRIVRAAADTCRNPPPPRRGSSAQLWAAAS